MPNKVIVACDTCGTSISKYPSLVNPHNFCSDGCYRAYRRTLTSDKSATWKGGMATLQCARCGQSFQTFQALSDKAVYCSRECKAAAQRHPRKCKQCGKEYTGAVRTFCSLACSIEFRSQNPGSMAEETKQKISAANKGKPGLSGTNNPNYKHGQEQKRLIICPCCGKEFEGKGHRVYCSEDCHYLSNGNKLEHFYRTPDGQKIISRYSQAWQSANNPNWQGGTNPYAPGLVRAVKRQVLERDDHCCRRCGVIRSDNALLNIHHIDGSKTNHDIKNLVTLCRACHSKVHILKIDASVYLP